LTLAENDRHPLSLTLQRCLLLCLLLAGTAQTAAQGIPLHFNRYSTDDGLSQNSIYAMHQDEDGFLWLGTLDGLNRFDGHRFEIFHLPSRPRSTNQTVHAIVEDRQGRFWLGTRGGLYRFNRQRETFTAVPMHIDDVAYQFTAIGTMLEDQNGTLWLASLSHGLFRYDETLQVAITVSLPVNDHKKRIYTQSLFEDRGGNLWLGTKHNGLMYKARHQNQWQQITLPGLQVDEWINTITQDGNGDLWLGTAKGLWKQRSNGDFRRWGKATDAHHVLSLFKDSKNHLWVGTDDGLLFKPEGATSLLHITLDPLRLHNPQNRYVRCFYEDRFNTLWLGAWGGLYQTLYQSKPFITLTTDTQLPNRLKGAEILAVTRDARGGLWLGHENGVDHLSSFNTLKNHAYHPGQPQGPGGRKVLSLVTDSTGQIWMGTSQDITIHRPNSPVWKHVALPLEKDGSTPLLPRVLKIDSNGQLWVGTRNGLYCYHSEKNEFCYIPHQFKTLDIFSMALDNQAGLFLGTWSGLFHYNFSKNLISRIQASDSTSGVDTECIRSIYRESETTVWLGTRGTGLIKLNRTTGETRFFNSNQGLAQDWVQAILPDRQGRLWLATNNGLSRFSPAQETFRTYRKEMGIWQRDFNLGAACHDRTTGTLCFGAMGGAVVFNPESILDEEWAPRIYFTDIQVNGKAYSPQSANQTRGRHPLAVPYERDLLFPPHAQMLKICFSALSFSAPHLNTYYYKLSGSNNKHWECLGNKSEVTLGPLKPGHYRLSVKGSNGDAVMSPQASHLNIEIMPHWYQHPVFKFSLLATSILLALLFFRMRTLQIERQNRWLTQRVKQRTSELSDLNCHLESELQQRLHAEAQLREHSKILEKRVAENTQHMMTLKKKEHQNQKLAAMGKATSTVVHEIRNPLTSLKMSLSALSSRIVFQPREKQCMDLAISDVKRMEGMLKEMLDFTQPMQFHFAFDGLNEVIQSVINVYTDELQEYNISVATDFSNHLSPVKMDLRRIDQAIRHLIKNAISAMPQGGALNIKTESDLNHGDAILIMRDTGMGIRSEYLPLIYEPFFTGRLGGSGLGLTIVQKIILAHKGRIDIQSELHAGTTVTITLPVDNGLTLLTDEELPTH